MPDAAETLRALEEALVDKAGAEDSEQSLHSFIQASWHELEPVQPFVDGWPLQAICDALEAVTRGEVTRLLINVPPGTTKSMATSVFWPSWEWGPRRMAHLRYILASYEQDLATRDNVRARNLLTSDFYRAHWGDVFDFKDDVNLKLRYENTCAGFRQVSSVGSALIGHRGDRIILDDPHAPRDVESEAVRGAALRWFTETLPTRLNNLDESAIVVIMQRVHEQDVSGLILAKELGYEHLMLPMEYEPARCCYVSWQPSYGPDAEPVHVWRHTSDDSAEVGWRPEPPEEGEAEEDWRYCADPRTDDGELLWPARFSREAVEQLKKQFRSQGGSYAEAGQLQQRPVARGGGMFQRKDFQYLDAVPEGCRWVRGWDLAATEGAGAFTAGAKVGLAPDGRVVIADVTRAQVGPDGAKRMLVKTAEHDGTGVPIDVPQDPGQAGKAQKSWLAAALHGYNVRFSPETGSKEVRATPLAAQAEAGNLYLLRAPWNDAFVAEACMFPRGARSDQIDAASRGYAALLRHKRASRPIVGAQVIG